jgi:plastocyanin
MRRHLLLVSLSLAALAAAPGAELAQAGRIEGRVQLRERPARRSPSRYPGGGAAPARPVQGVPAVIYLEGAIPGVPAAGARTATMAQHDTAFAPAAVVIPVGGTVVFPNDDPFFHNVFSYSTAERFDLGRYPRGESKTVRFDTPGVVKVYCEVHESMRAAVVVAENPFHAVVGADGSFTLTGVPPGRYTLVAWHVDLGEERTQVTVPAGGAARVDLTLD